MAVPRRVSSRLFTVAVAELSRPSESGRSALAAAVRSVPPGVDLVVLPFLGGIPYVPAMLDRAGYAYAERPPYATVQAVASAAADRGIAAAVSFYEVVGEGVFYSTVALLAVDGSMVGTYRQAHARNRPGQHEQLYFQPGTTGGFPVHRVGPAQVGFLLGGDLWVPEAARLLALGGADVLIAVTAVPSDEAENALVIARTRAAENGRAVILASRRGPGLAGSSAAFDWLGRSLDTDHRDETWLILKLDLAAMAITHPHDPLRLRRPRLYAGLIDSARGFGDHHGA